MFRIYLSGIDMSVSDYDGRTPLHIVSAEGHLECVEFLLVTCGVPHLQRDRYHILCTYYYHKDILSVLNRSSVYWL